LPLIFSRLKYSALFNLYTRFISLIKYHSKELVFGDAINQYTMTIQSLKTGSITARTEILLIFLLR